MEQGIEIKLRPLTVNDADFMVALASNPDAAKYLPAMITDLAETKHRPLLFRFILEKNLPLSSMLSMTERSTRMKRERKSISVLPCCRLFRRIPLTETVHRRLRLREINLNSVCWALPTALPAQISC